MARCLVGALVVAAGLVALASATRGVRSSVSEPASTGGTRLRQMEVLAVSGSLRTLLRPTPAFDLRFSLN